MSFGEVVHHVSEKSYHVLPVVHNSSNTLISETMNLNRENK